MRTTHTKPADYSDMLNLAERSVGSRAVDIIDAFANKKRVVSHRAGKVFWALVEDGKIVCTYADGIAWVSKVEIDKHIKNSTSKNLNREETYR